MDLLKKIALAASFALFAGIASADVVEFSKHYDEAGVDFTDNYGTYTLSEDSLSDGVASNWLLDFNGIDILNIENLVFTAELWDGDSFEYYDHLAVESEEEWTGFRMVAGDYNFKVTGTTTGVSGGGYSFYTEISPVPEPSTYALMLAGLGLVGFMARRRKLA